MKKQQKIIEINTSAKVKLENLKAEMKTAIAIAAQTHADILAGRTDKCDNERFNEIERFRAEKLAIEADFYQKKAALFAETKTACKEATDDPEQETDTENDSDVTVKGFQPQQETVYCDGSEHSARIVARRLINKMPRVKCDGALFVHIICDSDGDYFVSVSEQSKKLEDYISTIFSKDGHCEKSEAQFVERARKIFKANEDEAITKAAEPMARALDAVFGGGPVEQVDNLISDTFKNRKEGGNE